MDKATKQWQLLSALNKHGGNFNILINKLTEYSKEELEMCFVRYRRGAAKVRLFQYFGIV